MTVLQLKTLLSELPDSMPVYVRDGDTKRFGTSLLYEAGTDEELLSVDDDEALDILVFYCKK